MEQMINQVNQLNLHLLQPRISKNRDMAKELSTIQCYKCWEMGHYLRKRPNLPTLATRENVGSFTQRFSAEEKGKAQVHLIESMSEWQEKALMGLEKGTSKFLRMRLMSWGNLVPFSPRELNPLFPKGKS